MNYIFLQDLMGACAEYELSGASPHDLQAFGLWLSKRDATISPNVAPANAEQSKNHVMSECSIISQLLTYLTRYAKHYSKSALMGTPIRSIDEFVYLATILKLQSCSKSHLYQLHRQEKPTGIEIIGRLIVLGLVEQHPDPSDKRSSLLTLTPSGRALTYQLFELMGPVAEKVGGNLNANERQDLLRILRKLESFHAEALGKIPII